MSLKGVPKNFEVAFREPESVLQKIVGRNIKVVKFETSSLVKAGENFGSTILKVCATIKKGDSDEEEELNLVAKMLPPSEMQRGIFESSSTFKKEIFLYENLIPTYQSIYKKKFDIVPEFYGSRLSLKIDSNEIDDDAVILMENLKLKNYYMGERHKGLDKAHVQATLESLAKFHAIGLAIKEKKPAFISELKKYSKTLIAVDNEHSLETVQNVLDATKDDPEIYPYIERIKACNIAQDLPKSDQINFNIDHPWACVVHKDLWVNNILFHCNIDGNIDSVKIVDFQTYCAASPLVDIVFFLCTSMAMPLNYFDEMLEYYRVKITETLQKLNVDCRLFSEPEFNRRLKIDAVDELFHIICLSRVVEGRPDENLFQDPPSEHYIKRFKKIIQIYVEKKWI